ncbi:unnamed protein product [Pieris macdunnoughi]|uniref:Uncharacterized protein n=1 Tax=Pieris macdunnoughi TaxID=345717 RepID=A0A821UKV4_9NEOP|nr:unnamed protein product [Pieris macdunnoughi]
MSLIRYTTSDTPASPRQLLVCDDTRYIKFPSTSGLFVFLPKASINQVQCLQRCISIHSFGPRLPHSGTFWVVRIWKARRVPPSARTTQP